MVLGRDVAAPSAPRRPKCSGSSVPLWALGPWSPAAQCHRLPLPMMPANNPETNDLPLLAADTPQCALGEQTRSRFAGARWLPEACAALVALLSLLLPLAWSGLWSPYELETAELSRRIAHALHGAQALALEGTNNTVPILSELGRGQLPF